jgi:GTP-binding protein
VALIIVDATEGVTAGDATIAGYAHESGRSVIVVINKWDLVTSRRTDGKAPADRKLYEEQVRRHLKFLSYAPTVFVSATMGHNLDKLFSMLELVARERRKRIGTGEMNRFLSRINFERASVPVAKRVKIYYMTQAAVAPPTFILFTDRAVKLHFSYERFLENQIRAAFGFVGTPIWIKNRARNPAERSSKRR